MTTGYLGTPTRAAAAGESVSPAPAQLWQADIGRGVIGVPAMGDHVIVVSTPDRYVTAVSTATGSRFWRHRAEAPLGTGPLIAGNRVYVGTTGMVGRVSALELRTGRRVWQVVLGDIASPMALRDTILYAVSQPGGLAAISTGTGHVLWRQKMAGTESGPIVVGGRVAVVTLSDSLYVLDRLTGTVETRRALRSSTLAPLALGDDSTLVMASPSGALVALALPSGDERWRVETGRPVYGMPAVARDTVFALTDGCVLWTVPLARPAEPDSVTIPGCGTVAGPTVLRDGVLVATIRGEVTYFDRATARRVWTRGVGTELRQPALVHAGQIVAGPVLGKLASFR